MLGERPVLSEVRGEQRALDYEPEPRDGSEEKEKTETNALPGM